MGPLPGSCGARPRLTLLLPLLQALVSPSPSSLPPLVSHFFFFLVIVSHPWVWVVPSVSAPAAARTSPLIQFRRRYSSCCLCCSSFSCYLAPILPPCAITGRVGEQVCAEGARARREQRQGMQYEQL